MGYFQVRYDSRVLNYACRGFIRLATVLLLAPLISFHFLPFANLVTNQCDQIGRFIGIWATF